MRIEIDWTRCDGHGLCAALAPERIGRDEWGFPVLPRDEVPEAQARRLVAACPALALRAASGQAPPTTMCSDTRHDAHPRT